MPDTQRRSTAHYGALQHVLESCHARGLERTILDAFERVVKRGRERAPGGLDFAALLQTL